MATMLQLDQPTSAAEASLHLLPCSIAVDGPAPISTYFLARPYPNPTPPQAQLEAAFRGRRLYGVEGKLPDGFSGVLLSIPTTASTVSTTVEPSTTNSRPRPSLASAGGVSKRGRVAAGRGRGRGSAAAALAAARAGRRTSPRKSVQEATSRFFSLDGDSDSDSGDNQPAPDPASPVKVDVAKQEDVEEVVKKETDSQVEAAVEDLWAGVNDGASTVSAQQASGSSFASLADSECASTLFEAGSTSASTVITEPPATTAADTAQVAKVLTGLARFDRITFWKPDSPFDDEVDPTARAIQQWTQLADLIHAH